MHPKLHKRYRSILLASLDKIIEGKRLVIETSSQHCNNKCNLTKISSFYTFVRVIICENSLINFSVKEELFVTRDRNRIPIARNKKIK